MRLKSIIRATLALAAASACAAAVSQELPPAPTSPEAQQLPAPTLPEARAAEPRSREGD